ncbi:MULTISPECIES: glyoxylate/hydroxypyruvate reductase A [unclassified Achromobacter]|uniref:2-hydroxyacid dehydrogenase n=1 Tax=unclassified Achromobacter TaxID=2626865 RepID=UPI000B51B231|nr:MULTISPECIES: glyoxylate/hydroxypyruvate reductase A [unclassified Achromobacter]OWT73503.1 glyoxylate/hydroxypyruvate reductase A [Achromobacter sp. HZ34]OWT79833.1 glyoxylate/hydroxypyruvate reductase A [Achromobacter sp. HZ28]
MTKIVFFGNSSDIPKLVPLARAHYPDLQVYTEDDPGALDAEVAACWRPAHGALARYPRLRLIHAIAAGVDNILEDPQLPPLPICRVVAPDLAQGMSEFVLWSVLLFHRNLDQVLMRQRQHRWQRVDQEPAASRTVGILGLGTLGTHVAQTLCQHGYRVQGWSRQAKQIANVRSYAGADQLDDFLAGSDILVCLLPLTDETQGILNRRLLSRLPRGAALVHCGRGGHLVSDDVLALVREGHLRGAVLDVFEVEPLAATSPLWDEPNIYVTPHIASANSLQSILDQISENIRRLHAGEPLQNLVDAQRGY